MKVTAENSILTVFLEGRIDHFNAPALGAELNRLLDTTPHSAVVLNAEAVEYLSSAGLRVILAVRKKEPALRIVNASRDVYEVFSLTGFTEMMPIERALTRLSVEGCPVLGHGAKGTVYRYNEETIVKVYKKADSLADARRERELARRAFVLDIPTAISYDIVRVGDSYGSVFELLDAKSYTQLLLEQPENFDRYLSDYTALLQKIHRTKVRTEDMPNVKEYVFKWLDEAAPYLHPETNAALRSLVENAPDTQTMLHGDFHTNNILLQNGEIILIDMDTLSHGHPIFDLVNIYLAYVGHGALDPTVVERFLGMPYELAGRFWKSFLPRYLGTQDEALLEAVKRKVQLFAVVRLLRHTVRRMKTGTPEELAMIDYCRKRIETLLPQVDTLNFGGTI